MTRRIALRPEQTEAEGERERAVPAAVPPSLLDLQRSAGNAAVARVLARDAVPTSLGFGSPTPVGPIGSNPLLTYRPTLPADVQEAVDRWLSNQAGGIRIAMNGGVISMPEVIDRVRRGVPEAASASQEAIRSRVIELVGAVPETRTKQDIAGQNTEWASRIANAFPVPPTSVTFGGSKNSVTIGIHGAEIKTGKLTTTADKEGAEAELKQGGAKVGVSGKWDGSEFGLKTEVAGVKFETKVHPLRGNWGWTGGIMIPFWGEDVDELPDIGAAVGGAHAAISESLGHLRGGGSLTDGFVTDRMGKIKPAIEAIGNVAGRKGKSGGALRITAGAGEGGGWTAGVSFVIAF